MQQFLYRIQPIRDTMLVDGATPEEKRFVSEHFEYLQTLERNGLLILAGRTQNTDPSSFGIVLYRAENIDKAREIMLADPAVKNKIFRAELFPYRVALLKEKNVGEAQ